MKKISLLFLGLLAGLLLVEGLARLSLPYPQKQIALLRMRAPDLQMDQYTDLKAPGYNPFIQRRPQSEWICDGKTPEKMNNEGFRGRDFIIEPAKDRLRLAVVGDSFTEGWMGPRDAAFPLELERINPKLEILNFGMANRSPLRYLALYDGMIRKYHPSIVLVCLYQNDLMEDERLQEYAHFDSRGVPDHFDFERYFKDTPRMPQTRWEKRRDKWEWFFCQHSRLYPYVMSYLGVTSSFRKKNLETPSASNLPAQWKNTSQHLETLSALTREDRIPLLLAYVPDQGDFSKVHPLHAFAHEFSEAHHVPYFDGNDFLSLPNPERFYIPGDGHFSVEGHREYARLLEKWLHQSMKNQIKNH